MNKTTSVIKGNKHLLIVTSIILLVLIFLLLFPVNFDSTKKSKFNAYKSYFIEFNNFIEDYYKSKNITDELTISFSSNEFGIITHIYDEKDIKLDGNISNALTEINKIFSFDFSFVTVSSERIFYGGKGNEGYVFLKQGIFPTYFYSKEKKQNFTCYSLGDNWYYLYLKVR